MPVRLRQWNLKLVIAFFAALAAVVAQDPTSYLTPDVLRVGDKLACRCGGCRNTVGNCPMLHCGSADPMRRKIYEMQKRGLSDANIVSAIVREEGIVALAAPPAQGIGPIVTWLMPGIALLIGFFIYSRYVRRNQKDPEPLSAADQATLNRFRAQIDREFDESSEPRK
ncbi:MAG: cytochrome c-type biogenesis protein CcmH [Acidobacteriaceae bacterium]|nr:cytochrome c-type biogenesis protein CcmH [Acidobacteriaceae bacterium]MBV9295811.1 cytochrome c-type biogenesis protein CcmH [Acidobacteriaceae bacterium]MBV9763968.1 cytochrome c-type biogenesis protein CcmH [Acidobacteriaceae bacterium]